LVPPAAAVIEPSKDWPETWKTAILGSATEPAL
jgi:hypothetical protein